MRKIIILALFSSSFLYSGKRESKKIKLKINKKNIAFVILRGELLRLHTKIDKQIELHEKVAGFLHELLEMHKTAGEWRKSQEFISKEKFQNLCYFIECKKNKSKKKIHDDSNSDQGETSSESSDDINLISTYKS